MNFIEQQENIKNYIQNNLPAVLGEAGLNPIDNYVDDFLDFDVYKGRVVLFYEFSAYNYDYLATDAEDEESQINIYLVFRNDNGGVLRDNMLKYASAFYEMFDRSDRNFGGVADYGKIDTVQFYNAANGSKNIKVCELSITLHTERD